jgi:hypothetical protein
LQKKHLAILPYVFTLLAGFAFGACMYFSQDDLGSKPWEEITVSVVLVILCIYYTLCMYSLSEIIKIEENHIKSYKYYEKA